MTLLLRYAHLYSFFSFYCYQISEIAFGKSHRNLTCHSHVDPEADFYNFGVLLLEIIYEKLPYCAEHGHITDWVSLKEKLDVIYEVIK